VSADAAAHRRSHHKHANVLVGNKGNLFVLSVATMEERKYFGRKHRPAVGNGYCVEIALGMDGNGTMENTHRRIGLSTNHSVGKYQTEKNWIICAKTAHA
jgi:hypothetical protein